MGTPAILFVQEFREILRAQALSRGATSITSPGFPASICNAAGFDRPVAATEWSIEFSLLVLIDTLSAAIRFKRICKASAVRPVSAAPRKISFRDEELVRAELIARQRQRGAAGAWPSPATPVGP